jgi:hypothetical protein
MANSTWLAGSFNLAEAVEITVGESTVEFPAGDFYIRDADDDLSAIKQLELALEGEFPGAVTVYIRRDRKVQIDLGENTSTLAFPPELEDIFGFTQSPYAEAGSFTADKVSTLLFSPGHTETTHGHPVGTAGFKRYDRVVLASPTGQTFDGELHHTQTLARWSWMAVPYARSWTPPDGEGGQFVVFMEAVIVPLKRMKLYTVDEDDSSSSTATWSTALGPYIVPEIDEDWYRRLVARTDLLGINLGPIEALKVGDY